MQKRHCSLVTLFILYISFPVHANDNPSLNDSIHRNPRLKQELIRRTRTGFLLSTAGTAVTATGLLLPYIGNSKAHPGAILGTSLGMTLLGSTTAAISTSVIYRWGRDHVRGLPTTKTWLVYKMGVAGMFSGLILTAAAGASDQSGFGPLVFLGGEALVGVSSVMSLFYCTKVRSGYKQERYQYFVMPSVISRERFGMVLQGTF